MEEANEVMKDKLSKKIESTKNLQWLEFLIRIALTYKHSKKFVCALQNDIIWGLFWSQVLG